MTCMHGRCQTEPHDFARTLLAHVTRYMYQCVLMKVSSITCQFCCCYPSLSLPSRVYPVVNTLASKRLTAYKIYPAAVLSISLTDPIPEFDQPLAPLKRCLFRSAPRKRTNNRVARTPRRLPSFQHAVQPIYRPFIEQPHPTFNRSEHIPLDASRSYASTQSGATRCMFSETKTRSCSFSHSPNLSVYHSSCPSVHSSIGTMCSWQCSCTVRLRKSGV